MSRISDLSSRIFVGGLNQSVSEDDLEKAFKLFGQIIHVIVMRDRDNGRSRGFAFISFKNSQSSEEAISRMHGVEIRGKCVSVRHAEKTKHDNCGDRSIGQGRGASARWKRGLSSHGVETFQPSNRVYVTPDNDQESIPPHLNHHSSSPGVEWVHDRRQKGFNATQAELGKDDVQTYFQDSDSTPDRCYSCNYDNKVICERFQHQWSGDKYRDELQMSPAREINDYINSRGKSYSPLKHFTKNAIMSANVTEVVGDFDKSSSPRNIVSESHGGNYEQRQEYRSSRSLGWTRDSSLLEYGAKKERPRERHFGHRSPSLRSERNHQIQPSPLFADRRQREYTKRGYVQMSTTMPKAQHRLQKRPRSRSPSQSDSLNSKQSRSHGLDSKGASPGPRRRGNSESHFVQGFDSDSRSDISSMRHQKQYSRTLGQSRKKHDMQREHSRYSPRIMPSPSKEDSSKERSRMKNYSERQHVRWSSAGHTKGHFANQTLSNQDRQKIGSNKPYIRNFSRCLGTTTTDLGRRNLEITRSRSPLGRRQGVTRRY